MINHINKTGSKTVKLPKPCKFCGALGHIQFVCPKKPKKPLNRVKRMKKVGRIGQKLLDQRKAYLKAFPGPHYCVYCIFVGVEEQLEEKDVQLEHFLTKNNRPDLRFDWSNIVKSCGPHNAWKSGMDGPEFMKLLDERRSL